MTAAEEPGLPAPPEMRRDRLVLPPNVELQLNAGLRIPVMPGFNFVVSIGPLPVARGLLQYTDHAVILSHPPGVTWPSEDSADLVMQVLGTGSGVMLAFARAEDALQCMARLLRERGQ